MGCVDSEGHPVNCDYEVQYEKAGQEKNRKTGRMEPIWRYKFVPCSMFKQEETGGTFHAQKSFTGKCKSSGNRKYPGCSWHAGLKANDPRRSGWKPCYGMSTAF